MPLRKPLVIQDILAEEISAADTLDVSSIEVASGGGVVVAGGGELTGLPATPAGSTSAVSKAYVDSVTAESLHEALDRLTHQINETSYDEATYVVGRLTNYTTWASAAKVLKIREMQVTYTGINPTQIILIQYDGAGVEKERLTHAITYIGSRVQTVTRTKT